MILEIQIKLLYFLLNITFSKILFFHPLSLNGTSQILVFEVPLVLMFSKKIVKVYQNIYKQCFYLPQLQGNQLLLGLSHLREHKFKHSFQDTLNPFCSCGPDVETNMHFSLYCLLFSNQRCTISSTVNDIDSSLANTDDTTLTDTVFLTQIISCLQKYVDVKVV